MPWIIPLIGAGVGVAQTVIAAKRAKQAREEAERLQPPKTTADAGVSRYYNEALRRYQTAPTATWQYKNAMNNIARNQAAGLSALKDRRALIGGVSRIVGGSNDASIKAAASAEADQNQKFSQLGGATGSQAADTRYLFNQNQIAPYQKQLTLAGMRGAANANTVNTGISNIYSGLNNAAILYGMNNYGNTKATAPPDDPYKFNLVSDWNINR